MACDLGAAVEDADQTVGGEQRQWPAHGLMRDRVVVLVKADVDGLRRADGAHEVGVEGMDRQFHQPGGLLREGGLHGLAIVLGPRPLGGDLASPHQRLTVEVDKGRETTGCEERIADVPDDPFDDPLLVSACRTTCTGGVVVMGGQFDQPRIEMDRASTALQNGGTEVVVQDYPGDPAQIREGVHVAAQEALQIKSCSKTRLRRG